jgi:Domain of unknown function (DUF3859)
MLRLSLAFVMVLGISAASAQAQSPRVDSVVVVRAGLMQADTKVKEVKNKSISTGTLANYPDDPRVVTDTRNIAINGKTIFGIEAKFNGQPEGRTIKVRVVWHYPDPGIKNPSTGVAKFRDEFETNQVLGKTSSYYWTADNNFTHVPGVWTVELWLGERRLTRQEFTILK